MPNLRPTSVLQLSSQLEADVVALLTRQPIFDDKMRLFGYEILYRNDVASRAPLDTLVDIGLETLVGETRAFVAVDRSCLAQDHCKVLPQDRATLKIPSALLFDDDLIDTLWEYKNSGYSVSLDNFVYSEELRPRWALADYLEISFNRFTHQEIAEQLELIGHPEAKLVAANLDKHGDFEAAKSMGFDYFRGPCFTRPTTGTATHVPLNRLSALELVLKLQEPDIKPAELERLVSQDVAISYKLLHFVNSASLSLSRNITSIKHAIQLVGTQRIRVWATFLLMLSKLDDKPAELITTALVRATMAERMAQALNSPNPESHFMAGLFSVADAMLNLSMPKALELLPFSKPIRDALEHGAGPMGAVLHSVLAYEAGRWSEVECEGLPLPTIRQCYLDALAQVRQTPK